MLLPRPSEIEQHAIERKLSCAVVTMNTHLLNPLASVVLLQSRHQGRGRPLDHHIQIRQISPWIAVLVMQQGITHSTTHES